MEIFNKTIGLLEKSLDIRSEKNRVISANIANQDTPGYRAKEVNFKDTLRAVSDSSTSIQLSRSNSSHLGGVSASPLSLSPSEIAGSSTRLDGNTVDSEMEMAKLAENTLFYNASAQMISGKFKMLQYAITEGK